jgi:hypothetical protein
VAVVDLVTVFVVTVNVAVVLPAARVTVAGTVADVVLLDKATEMPPLGAAPVRVTVAVDEAPPLKLAGLRDTEDSAAADAIVNAEVLLTLL